jgi:hypothetical protein
MTSWRLVIAWIIVTAGCGRVGFDVAARTGDASATDTALDADLDSPYARAVLQDHPVGYWRLGEHAGSAARDLSGNALDGSYVGGVTLGQPGAIADDPDTAIALDGTTGFVRVPTTPLIDAIATSVASVDAWVKGGLNGAQEVFSSWDGASSGFQLIYNTGTAGAWSGNGIVHSSVVVSDANWHYLAVVWDGGDAAVYVDGVETGSGASMFSPTSKDNQLGTQCGGADSTDCSLYRPGDIDEVAVYPTALSAARIMAHYMIGHGD